MSTECGGSKITGLSVARKKPTDFAESFGSIKNKASYIDYIIVTRDSRMLFIFYQYLYIYICTFLLIVEETLAHKVCLLLIELYIVTEQPDAALSILNYVESQFISIDNSKISSVDKDGAIRSIKEQREQKKDIGDTAIDAFKIKLLKYKARIYLLTHQPKLCKKEWKTLVSLGTVVILLQ